MTFLIENGRRQGGNKVSRDWSLARVLFFAAFVCFLIVGIVAIAAGFDVKDLTPIGLALVALGLAV